GAGAASAVLVRALEPALGVVLMRRRRGLEDPERLARGPACVTVALGIDRSHDGLDLESGPLWVSDRPAARGRRGIASSARIGIRVGLDLPWRFFLPGHPCVSGAPARGLRTPPAPATAVARGRNPLPRKRFPVDTPVTRS